MTTDEATVGADALALITLARDSNANKAELLILALDNLKGRDEEELSDLLAREAQLVAVLATFAAELASVLDGIAPGVVDDALQNLGQRWAERLANPPEST